MKNLRAITLLLFANAISGVAQGISMIAIPWYFTNVIDKSQLFGFVYFSVTLVSLFWGPYAGTIVDKFDRKRIMLFVTATGAILISIMALLALSSGPVEQANGESHQIHWLIVALAFATTVLIYNIHYPNLYAFAQEITEIRHYGRITSYLEIQGQATFAISGAIGAILLIGTEEGMLNILGMKIHVGWNIKAWPLYKIFIMDAATYVISFILLFSMNYIPVYQRKISNLNIKDRFTEGFSFLKENKLIFIFGNASFFVFATILVASFYIIPRYINIHLNSDADVYSSAEMYFAIGSLVAGFLVNNIFKTRGPVRGIIVLTSIASIIYVTMIFNTNIAIFYATYMLLGLSNAGIRIMRMTYLFRTVPNEVIGRLGSIFMVLNTLFRLSLILLFSIGFFTQEKNVIYTFLILGIFTLSGLSILVYYKRPLQTLNKD